MGLQATYNESYLITVAFIDAFAEQAKALDASLQRAYDAGNVAGHFEWQRLGRVTVLRFEREISEDMDVLTAEGREMNELTVAQQLASELKEVLESGTLEDNPEDNVTWNMLNTVIQALEQGQPHVEVEGLPCQAPRLRLVIELSYPDKSSMAHITSELVFRESALKAFAKAMNGDLLTHTLEEC